MFEILRYLCQLPRKLSHLSRGSVPFWLVLHRYAFYCFRTYFLFFFFKKNWFGLFFSACSSKCQRCSDNPDNCTSCKNRLTSGKCVQTCPKGTHNVSGNCIPCHGDCAACSGLGYNECTECHPDRPVLSNNGRCLRTCSKKTQYFNPSTSLCVDCDPSCSSCSADGPSNCLACSNPTDILKGGQCSSSSQRGDLIYLGMDFGT